MECLSAKAIVDRIRVLDFFKLVNESWLTLSSRKKTH